jgi:hypothetical protein
MSAPDTFSLSHQGLADAINNLGVADLATTVGGAPLEVPMRNLWNKIFNIQATSVAPFPHVKWMLSGDSMSQDISQWYFPYLARQFGGVVAGAYFSGNYTGMTTNSSSGTITANTTDFDAWYSGITDTFATNASRTYGIGGSTFVCDLVKVFYVKGPASSGKDGGVFSLRVDGVDVAGATSLTTSAAAITLGVASFAPSVAAHDMSVVCNTGPVRIIGVGMENTQIRGLVPINCSQGGIALNSPQTSAWTNYSLFLANVLPDVLTYEGKEDSTYFASALKTFFDAIASGTRACDVIGVGSGPVSPAQYNNRGEAEQILQNQILRTACEKAGYNYWDGFKLLGNWAKVNALGWGTDPVHLTDQANKFRAAQFMRDVGSTLIWGQPSPTDISPANATIATDLKFGKTSGAPVADFNADNTFDFDLNIYAKRYIRFYSDAAMTTEVVRLDLAAATGFQPRLSRLGPGMACVYGNDANTVRATLTSGSGASGDFLARGYRTDTVTANVSGAVTSNLTTGCVQILTLTANITSFVFSNSVNNQIVELQLVQGAGGPFTAAGFNANMKWAGGAAPALSGTIGWRDIFVFRVDSGNYYEISRSLAVR